MPLGRGFKTVEMRACPFSPYIMLVHLYDSHVLPSTATTWRQQAQGLAHLLQVRVNQLSRLYLSCIFILYITWITDNDFMSNNLFVLELYSKNCFWMRTWRQMGRKRVMLNCCTLHHPTTFSMRFLVALPSWKRNYLTDPWSHNQ